MATAIYSGSPRHHSRMLVSSTGGPKSAAHLPSALALQQSTPFISGIHQTPSNIIIPPASYLAPSLHQQQHHHSFIQAQSRSSHHSKRKSAVELLAETKQYYVKSETVRERQQQLSYSRNSAPPTYIVSPSRTLPHNKSGNRRSASSSSDLLQTKLRKLLNAGDSKETITPESLKYQTESPPLLPLKYDQFQYSSSSPKRLNQELTVHPEQQSDNSVFFPSAFLSPQSLPPHPASDDDLYSYGIDDTLTDDYGTISPPAEYAEVTRSTESNGANNRHGYQRSFSHSQTVVQDPAEYSPSYNINSHKSLPDLHSQISRHSPHSEVLSCCSRGNRSNKSGSSFNRDSGGSSGHYTHRSEPCCKQKESLLSLQSAQTQQPPPPQMSSADFRRDSGSSTQHSGNSYYNNYGIISNYRYDCAECRAKLQKDAECLLNFTTPEVPEAFQDDYDGKTKSRYHHDDSPRKYYQATKNTKSPPPPIPGPPITPPDPAELSPPLGTFKRQKCLRFKHRGRYSNSSQMHEEEDRRPILRSKSDISDRYWNRQMPLIDAAPASAKMDKRTKSESMSQLEKFFDRLGLNDETYEKYIAPKSSSNYNSSDNDSDQSSPVFFSDVSTVDSNRLPDSTETSNQTNTALYRPSEPPSIVERNARIIKWLCNCKKMQLA